jgi:poly(hydroxyalkanoate) depolymerase family esterase
MAGLRKTLARLDDLRHRFENLVAVARRASPRSEAFSRQSRRLPEIRNFGANPGNLRMLAYVPDSMPRMPPLVVALHGCTQTADGYDYGTGWSTLADRLGFVVVYPQQQPSNNPKNCFSWFLPGDIERERGEAMSIRQMIEEAVVNFGVDRRRVFVTGLSAGGAMASVMLATYPEVFAGGAIIAGLPYGCATSVQEAFEAMFDERSTSARALSDRVRAASRHQGSWPKISVWHGSADPIVKPSNAENLIRQWTDVQGLSARPSHEEKLAGHIRRVWNDASGNTLVEAFSISGMGHGVPLATGAGVESCGAVGPFFLDVGISSTHNIAQFFGLGDVGTRAWRAATKMATSAAPIGASLREVDVIARAGDRSVEPVGVRFEHSDTQGARQPLDPNRVIAAAFKAAGLPLPENTSQPPGSLDVAPGPIIEAALKAAGLMRR